MDDIFQAVKSRDRINALKRSSLHVVGLTKRGTVQRCQLLENVQQGTSRPELVKKEKGDVRRRTALHPGPVSVALALAWRW